MAQVRQPGRRRQPHRLLDARAWRRLGFGQACTLTGRAWPRCASLDGDADRIVYWTPAAAGGGVALFDGDRIAALAALLVCDLLDALPADEHTHTVRLVEVLPLLNLMNKTSQPSKGLHSHPAAQLATWAHGSSWVSFKLCLYALCALACLKEVIYVEPCQALPAESRRRASAKSALIGYLTGARLDVRPHAHTPINPAIAARWASCRRRTPTAR